MFSIIKRGLTAIHSKGLKGTLYWFYFGYLKTNRFFLFRRAVSNPFQEIEHQSNILIKQMSIEELKELREIYSRLPEEFFCDTFEGSKTCFVGFVGEKVAHIMWVFFAQDKSRFFYLKEKEAEINYAVTLPGFRGMNLYPLAVKSVINLLRENRYKWLYGAIHEKNINAIKAIGKCGFEKIGEITNISFWRPKWKSDL